MFISDDAFLKALARSQAPNCEVPTLMVYSGTTIQLCYMAVANSSSAFMAVWTGLLFSPRLLASPPVTTDGLQHLGEVAVKGKRKEKFGF